MELPMLSRKRSLFHGHEKEPPLYTKKCLVSLKTLLDRYQTDRSDRGRLKTNCVHPFIPEYCVNGDTKSPADTKSLFEQLSCWADTQTSVQKVLEHLKFRHANDDIFLNDSINRKFLEFHRDITEECGAEDKQHSWAVIEKQEEIVMYGPYYPNYIKGEHSEDIIIKQTQELLESDVVTEDWKVYVFTMNSPCLARNTAPCMLNLVQKAQEWWSVHGDQIRLTFQQCWKEMVQDKSAEFIREKLTEDFNQCTVQLFIKDAVKCTKQYLQIGRIRFPEEDSQAPQVVR
ncbi:hypothetical protein D5F01_LYC14824 [Larimichthys crocea]|uniref:Uncharacterized protein n=1 Tax=Larimichthys crocea TaxID=215358 RepID=A0A6G0I5W1_LARCR|nr:hypothetical protein D5F01_LYC14824 [Larimichthys crocea]